MQRERLLRWAGLILLAGAIVLALIYRDRLDAGALERLVAGSGVAGPLLFMLIYALATVLFLPGSVLTLAGGALFGPVLGTFYNLTGATAGAVLAFLAARYFASGWVEQKIGGRLKQLKEGVEAEGWRFVAFVRLVPLFPFNLLNYALGLTRIRLSHYLIASTLFMLPGALAYTYLGYAGREAMAGGENLIQKGLLALALLAGAAFLPRLVGHLRERTLGIEELNARLDRGEGLLVLDVRTAHDSALGHIPGALNIPLEELEARLPELTPFAGRTLAIICTTDRRSKKAAQWLTGRGFADLRVVSGGMTRWNQTGLPIETGG